MTFICALNKILKKLQIEWNNAHAIRQKKKENERFEWPAHRNCIESIRRKPICQLKFKKLKKK